MSRTDVHRPSEIKPSDYFSIGWLYTGPDAFLSMACAGEREGIARLMRESDYRWSHHEHGGSCGVCGNVQAQTLVVFVHRPTGEVIRVGETCADKMDLDDKGAFKVARTKLEAERKAKAGKLKAQATLDSLGLSDAWTWHDGDRFTILGDLGEPKWTAGRRPEQGDLDAGDDRTAAWQDYVTAVNAYEQAERDFYREQAAWERKTTQELGKPYRDARFAINTLGDMIDKLVRYGSWSEAQAGFATRLWGDLSTFTDRLPELKAEAVTEAAKRGEIKITAGRYEIEGAVVSTRVDEGDYGTTRKMLVKRDDGGKFWGTIPAALLDQLPDPEAGSWVGVKLGARGRPCEELKGYRVAFTAKVTPREPGFATYSRPGKATLLEDDGEERVAA